MDVVFRSLNSYRADRVCRVYLAIALGKSLVGFAAAIDWYKHGKLTFDHVLNVPVSEEIWSGEAATFFPELFAVAPYGDEVYVLSNDVHYHMRYELIRMYGHEEMSATKALENDLALWFYCYGKGPSPSAGGDGCEDEPDTLNSELLVYQEYVPPQDVPSRSPFTLPGDCNPTVGSKSPTEKEN